MNIQIIKIKFCKTCGCSSENNKFNFKECIKCASRKNNAKLKEKDYYVIYHKKHSSGLPCGRPRKIIIEPTIIE